MAKRKTESDYAAAITELHQQRIECPDSEAILKKIDTQVRGWMRRVDIVVQVAQNEQTPWTSEMIGYPTEPMPLKKDSGFAQTGDYAGVVRTSDGDRYVPVLCERKSIQDAYGTLIMEENRARFYREIERFHTDPRFDQMVVIVEGTLSDFLLHQPEFSGGKFDYKRRFATKKNDSVNEKKMTTLADLFMMDVSVLFCDNATLAARMYGRLIREAVRKKYWRVLELEPPASL